MKAKLKNKNLVAKRTLELTFKLEKKIDFEAGQYFFLRMFKEIKGGNRKHFSIVNPPENSQTITMATRLTGSPYKQALEKLEIGEEVEIDNVAGTFTLPGKIDKTLVFIAGGIGITPFKSMIEHVKNQNLDYEIELVYSNRDQESTVYFDRLKELNDQMDNLNVIFTMTSSNKWQEESRRIDKEFITDYFTKLDNYYFMIAGPPGMVGAVEKEVKKAGVNDANIKSENFTGYEKH